MPHQQNHRGPSPEDAVLFTESTRTTLRTALEEAAFLLERGYSTESVLDVVSRRHQLRSRQRTALQRSMCSFGQQRDRLSRCVANATLAGADLEVDGFNQIITTEVALSRGLLLRGTDGAYRDLAGLRGSYHPVRETDMAIALLGRAFEDLGVRFARIYLDQPISNSGRLKQRILDLGSTFRCELEVQVVRNPDRELIQRHFVVSSDAAVLDAAASWFNLTDYLLEHFVESAWVMDLNLELRHEAHRMHPPG